MKTIYTPSYETLIRYIRDKRELLKITQENLSANLDKHKTYVNKYESGVRRLDILELFEVCDILEINVYELMRAIKGDTEENLMEQEPFIHGFARGYLLGQGHDLPGGITTRIVGKYRKEE